MTTTLNKNGDNVIPTPAGTVHVRPFRSSSNAQLKAVLSFTPRMSSLDRENVKSQSDEFRGFFTLFWIGEASSFSRFRLEVTVLSARLGFAVLTHIHPVMGAEPHAALVELWPADHA